MAGLTNFPGSGLRDVTGDAVELILLGENGASKDGAYHEATLGASCAKYSEELRQAGCGNVGSRRYKRVGLWATRDGKVDK